MGANLLCPQLYKELKNKGNIHVNSFHRALVSSSNLFSKGEQIMSHIENSERKLIQDNQGNCYAVNVKFLGKSSFIKKIIGNRKIEKMDAVLVPDSKED